MRCDSLFPTSFQVLVIFIRVMTKAVEFFQTGFNFQQLSTRFHKICMRYLAQSLEQIVERFCMVNESRKRTIAQHEFMN
ncbi:hypothetical protein GEOBC_02575 [Geobacteraceae bacterium]|nr:hypothetical protein GEOBC_02575 [Geobacteraceae bacterium]